MKKKSLLGWALKNPDGELCFDILEDKKDVWLSIMTGEQQENYQEAKRKLSGDGWRVVRVEIREVKK